MGEKESIKELSEGLVGVLEFALFMAERFKDGIGLDDMSALWDKWKNDPDFKAKMKAAVDGSEKIPAEAKDLDLNEGMQLAMLMLPYVPKFIDAMKKESA